MPITLLSPALKGDYEYSSTARFREMTFDKTLICAINVRGKSLYNVTLFPKEAQDLASSLTRNGGGAVNSEKAKTNLASTINGILLREGHVYLDKKALGRADLRAKEVLEKFEQEAKMKRVRLNQ